jgi:hypothetical protein
MEQVTDFSLLTIESNLKALCRSGLNIADVQYGADCGVVKEPAILLRVTSVFRWACGYLKSCPPGWPRSRASSSVYRRGIMKGMD